MNADDFKPGDLAWGTVCDQRDVLLMRGWMGNVWISQFGPHGASTVTDLRPATILAPDERAVPKGHVVLDLEGEDAARLCDLMYAQGWKVDDDDVPALQRFLRTLAAEQQAAANPVPPEPSHDALVMDNDHNMWERDGEGWSGCHHTMWLDWGDLQHRGPLTVYRPDTKAVDL